MPENTRILLFGDVAVPTGFGRIGAQVGRYLHERGCHVIGACVQYDGLLPPPTGVPFFVAALNGKDHASALTGITEAFQPHAIVSLQDFPYHLMLRQATLIDWSTIAHVAVTPVDGVPIYRAWLDAAPEFDALLTISEFGVRAFETAGQPVTLCPPGVDTAVFHRLPDDQRAELRARLALPPDAFVLGVMAMNQGRKDYPAMLAGFAEAFRAVPDAYLYLDCEANSPAGWDIPRQLLAPNGLDPARVRFRADAVRAGLIDLNERYNLLDVHMVLAHREGFGLPHVEAMATGIPSVALDYCSGPEIVGRDDERGLLVRAEPRQFGTWGGAVDYDADLAHLAAGLRTLYENADERRARGQRAAAWAAARSWNHAGAAVHAAIKRALAGRDHAKSQPVEKAGLTA